MRAAFGRIARLYSVAFLAAALSACTTSPESPALPPPAPAAKRVLLLTHNTFYNHDNLGAIETVLPEWGRLAGFTVTSLEGYKQTASCSRQIPCRPDVADLSMIDASYLAQFGAIVVSTNGELPFTDEGKQALVDFVRDGKGILFLHQSMVTLYGFPPWGEMLGAYAGRLPSFDTMNAGKRSAVLRIEDSRHPATRDLPQHWQLDDEFAQFAKQAWDPARPAENRGPTGLPVPVAFSRERVNVVLSIDTHRTAFAGAPSGWDKDGDYPVAWYQNYGRGRTFYTSLGHRSDLWAQDAAFRSHIVGAIRWVLRLDN